MQYLRIKNLNSKTPNRARALVIKKNRKYGSVISETSVSVKRAVLVIGAAGSGKSYWLKRLVENSERIWKNSVAVNIDASTPLSAWVDNELLIAWYEEVKGLEWKTAKAWTRLDALVEFVTCNKKVILFIDDAHLLTGRKGKIATSLIKTGRVFIATAIDEGRLSVSLRQVILNSSPQIFRLNSDAAYDATPIFIWICVLICLGIGHWELAGILGGLQAFSGGRRASKQT